MRFKKLTPNVMVEDVDRTMDFYINTLGFEFAASVVSGSHQIKTSYKKGESLDWGMVKLGSVEIMIQARHSLAEELPQFDKMEIGGSLTIYIEIEGLDEYLGTIRDKVDMVMGPKTQFYGMREIVIRDCNGYFLAIGERA